MKVGPVACGLCHKTGVALPGVASKNDPHYCRAALIRAHARIVAEHARWRAQHATALAIELRRAALEAAKDKGKPKDRTGKIRDLCDWGDYYHCLAVGVVPSDDARSVAVRVDAILRAVAPAHVSALRAAYVDRGETEREDARVKPRGRAQARRGLPASIATAEDAYLESAKRWRHYIKSNSPPPGATL